MIQPKNFSLLFLSFLFTPLAFAQHSEVESLNDLANSTEKANQDQAIKENLKKVLNFYSRQSVQAYGCDDFKDYFKANLESSILALREYTPSHFTLKHMRNLIWEYSKKKYGSYNLHYDLTTKQLIELTELYLSENSSLDSEKIDSVLDKISKTTEKHNIDCGNTTRQRKSKPQDKEVETNDSSTQPPAKGTVLKKGWHQEYSNYLRQRIPDSFIKDPPSDIEKLCPKYHKLDDNEKREAWIQVIRSISYAETKHQSTLRYKEIDSPNDKVTGRLLYSEGLMQVSYQDSKFYGCHFNWADDKELSTTSSQKTIFNPYKNLDCSIRILENQFSRNIPLVATQGSHYWATLNPNSKSRLHWGFGALAYKMSEYKACGLTRDSFMTRFSRSVSKIGQNLFSSMWPNH